MIRAPLVASAIFAGGCFVVALMAAHETTDPVDLAATDSGLGVVLSNSGHDMPTAAEVLEQRGFDVSASGLLSLADDPGAELGDRYSALLALAEVDSPEAERILARALHSTEADLRYAAVVAFRDRDGKMAERALLGALDDPAEGVRSIAIASLATTGGPVAARALAGRLSLGLLGGYQAVDAAVTLGELGQPLAAPALGRVLVDSLAATCPRGATEAECLGLHLEAATQRDTMPIATDCSAKRAVAADLRAAVGSALVRLGEPSLPALVLGALDPCTSDWLRIDAIGSLSMIEDRPFVSTKSVATSNDSAILEDIATWWRQR